MKHTYIVNINDHFIHLIKTFDVLMQADVFDDCRPCPNTNNLVARPVVRRTVSDSIGARLRKISFEIGNGRRHSDEFTTEEFQTLPQVCCM